MPAYADRPSAATMRANQPRLWFAPMVYLLICALRRIGLAGTTFSGTMHLKLLKVGAFLTFDNFMISQDKAVT